jgi:membrane-associated phospholipid phosphatase
MTKDLLRTPFMTLCLGMLVILAYPLIVFPKGELVLLINKFHLSSLDALFKYVTNLGDGVVMAVLLVFLIFYSYKLSIVTAFSIIFQSIIVSVFKRWLFAGLERPIAFFGDSYSWNFVDGVDVHSSNTFPSGHTTTAFAFFAILVVIFRNRGMILSLLFFLLAYIVGFSRVYLLQHFVVDVYFGAIFGILSVILALALMDRLFNQDRLNQLHSKSLLTTISRKSGK